LLNFLTWTQISTTAQQVASELGYSVTPEAVRGLILVTMANITCNGKAVRCTPCFLVLSHIYARPMATNTDLQSGWMSSEWRHLLEQWTVPGQQMCLQFWLHGDILRFTCQQLHIRCRYHRRSRARYLLPFCVSVHPVPRLAQLTWYPLLSRVYRLRAGYARPVLRAVSIRPHPCCHRIHYQKDGKRLFQVRLSLPRCARPFSPCSSSLL